MEKDNYPKPIELLPHEGPMVLLDEILECNEHELVAVASISPNNPFLSRSGKLLPGALIEMIAQAAAAHMGYGGFVNGIPPPRGYLVGVRDTTVSKDLPSPGDEVKVRAGKDKSMGSFSWYSGLITLGDKGICSGTVMVFKEKS